MDRELQRLQELQVLDTRLAGLERTLEGIPGRIQAIRDGYQQAKAAVESIRAKLEIGRKDLRSGEKDLDFQASQRAKCEAKLYEVKTNKEYSAVLAEIETLKVEKGRIEEEMLALMEAQERMLREIGEAETRLRRHEQEARDQEAAATQELHALETDLAAVRGERESLGRELPRDLLAQYTRLLRGRGGLAVALVGASGICAGCRVTLTPQRFQEVRQSSQILTCESCGRILYYQP
ncbi:MAG: zinc ribbon domain-containing protein [Candidatus Rokuibacteriota bacterium]